MRDSSLPHRRPHWSLFGVIGFILILLAARSVDVFSGEMPDNDDLMRLQQVRDLLAGQDWFNVDQSRLLTPEGGAMHWSRLPDLGLSLLITLFRPFSGQTTAELIAITIWPLALLVWALSMIILIARRLQIGLPGQVIALAFFAMSGAIYNFWPGRIDHHNLVVALTLTALAALLSPSCSARSGAVAAVSITAMLSVAIESLPYAGALILALGLFWVLRGHREVQRMAGFGPALCLASTLFYLLDAPGWGAARQVCDAYGSFHWVGLLSGGSFLALTAILAGNIRPRLIRLGLGAGAGLMAVSLMALTNPACLADPYAAVSDQVRLAWLDVVGEARTLTRVWAEEPSRAVWQFGFVLSGVVASVVLVCTAKPTLRLARMTLLLLMVLSALATIWQIRGVTFSHVFGVIAAGGLVGLMFEHWRKRSGSGAVLALAFTAFTMAPMSWELLSRPFEKRSPYAVSDKPYGVLCLNPASYADLPVEAPLRIITPIDLGMSVLARTPHSVYVGPYHRNVQGIERITDIFLGAPEAAERKARDLGATHLLYCQGLNETTRYGLLSPDGFAAQLNQGQIPDWLEPLKPDTDPDGEVKLYRINPH